jgi:hypothetical protein
VSAPFLISLALNVVLAALLARAAKGRVYWTAVAENRQRNHDREQRTTRLLYQMSGLPKCNPELSNQHCPHPKGHAGPCWPEERARQVTA